MCELRDELIDPRPLTESRVVCNWNCANYRMVTDHTTNVGTTEMHRICFLSIISFSTSKSAHEGSRLDKCRDPE